jgi:hypothetical protein
MLSHREMTHRCSCCANSTRYPRSRRKIGKEKKDISSLHLFPLFDDDLCGTTYGLTMTGIYANQSNGIQKACAE